MNLEPTNQDLLTAARTQYERTVPFTRELRGWRGMAEWLYRADHVIKLNVPVIMDDGYVHNFTGFRVLHSAIRGPGVGGNPRSAGAAISELAWVGTDPVCDGGRRGAQSGALVVTTRRSRASSSFSADERPSVMAAS